VYGLRDGRHRAEALHRKRAELEDLIKHKKGICHGDEKTIEGNTVRAAMGVTAGRIKGKQVFCNTRKMLSDKGSWTKGFKRREKKMSGSLG